MNIVETMNEIREKAPAIFQEVLNPEPPPREYLHKVLKWRAFCKTHRKLEKAIIEILAENAFLKFRLVALEMRLKK